MSRRTGARERKNKIREQKNKKKLSSLQIRKTQHTESSFFSLSDKEEDRKRAGEIELLSQSRQGIYQLSLLCSMLLQPALQVGTCVCVEEARRQYKDFFHVEQFPR